ncbi:FAD-dependent oxidoreductase [Sphingomonas oligophenolica]|uniref:FAD-dependent monooxygenase n=1 Tax=Sphingomonas oligophenolica TaxID=301154 RepID=A0ABU9Y979_9SPHN
MIRTDILIVGAGPAGLTLACDLARRSIDFLIIERLAERVHASKGKGIQPRTLEIFGDLGIVDAVIAAGRPYPRLGFHEGGEIVREQAMMTERAPSEAVPYPNPVMIPQWKTEEILEDRLAQLGGAVRRGWGFVGFVQDADQIVVEAETPDGRVAISTRYLVAADGGRSPVRTAANIPLEGETPKLEGLLVADVTVADLDRDHWHVWGPSMREFVTLCPLPSTDAFQFQAALKLDENPEPTLETLRTWLERRAGAYAPRLLDQSWISVFRPNIRMAGQYRQGRLFLAGDAAHVHPPAGAQGLNTSVQDAYNLGWKLATALAQGSNEALLDSYEAERLPVAAAVLGLSGLLYKKGLDGEEAGMRRADDEHQLQLNYRGSPIVAMPADAGATLPLAPGDRMPNVALKAVNGTSCDLFTLLRGELPTLIGIDSECVTPADPLYLFEPTRRLRIDTSESGTATWRSAGPLLAALTGRTIAIRPDGYVASIGS